MVALEFVGAGGVQRGEGKQKRDDIVRQQCGRKVGVRPSCRSRSPPEEDRESESCVR